MALACVVAAVALVYLFLRSKRGLALLAIRDNEVAAESQGIPVARMKLAVYVVAAFGAGLAGALYFVGNLRISPDAAFSVNWTAFAIFMVVIGGIGRIEGPLVGALIRQRHGLDLGTRTLQRYLERWGFRAERPPEATPGMAWIRLHTLRLASLGAAESPVAFQFLVAQPARGSPSWLAQGTGNSLAQTLIAILETLRSIQPGRPLAVLMVGLDPARSPQVAHWLAAREDVHLHPSSLPATGAPESS